MTWSLIDHVALLFARVWALQSCSSHWISFTWTWQIWKFDRARRGDEIDWMWNLVTSFIWRRFIERWEWSRHWLSCFAHYMRTMPARLNLNGADEISLNIFVFVLSLCLRWQSKSFPFPISALSIGSQGIETCIVLLLAGKSQFDAWSAVVTWSLQMAIVLWHCRLKPQSQRAWCTGWH